MTTLISFAGRQRTVLAATLTTDELTARRIAAKVRQLLRVRPVAVRVLENLLDDLIQSPNSGGAQ